MKSPKVFAFCAVFLLAVMPFVALGQEAGGPGQEEGLRVAIYEPQPLAPDRWEYKVIDYEFPGEFQELVRKKTEEIAMIKGENPEDDPETRVSLFEAILNDYGKSGWEFVTSIGTNLIFGRRLLEDKAENEPSQTSGSATMTDEDIKELAQDMADLDVELEPLIKQLQLSQMVWQHAYELHELLQQLPPEFQIEYHEAIIEDSREALRLLRGEVPDMETEHDTEVETK